jgi:hypothetical protein
MKVYELLKENGFIIESPNGEDNFFLCNADKIFFLDFLNENGFSKQDNGNRLGSTGAFEYEYGSDKYLGRVQIIIKLDITKRLYIIFKCKKPEK